MGRRGSRGPSESRTDPCLLLAHRHRTYARGAFPPAAIMAQRHESGPRRAFPQLLSLSFPPVPRCVGMASALQRKLLLILQLASLMSPGQAWFRRMRAHSGSNSCERGASTGHWRIQSAVKAQSPKCTRLVTSHLYNQNFRKRSTRNGKRRGYYSPRFYMRGVKKA